MTAVCRDVQPIDVAADAEAGDGNSDGRLGVPRDRPVGLRLRTAERDLAVGARTRKVSAAEGERTAAQRTHLVERAAPDHGRGHGSLALPVSRDLGRGLAHGGGDPFIRSVGDAAIRLQRS